MHCFKGFTDNSSEERASKSCAQIAREGIFHSSPQLDPTILKSNVLHRIVGVAPRHPVSLSFPSEGQSTSLLKVRGSFLHLLVLR